MEDGRRIKKIKKEFPTERKNESEIHFNQKVEIKRERNLEFV